MHCTHDEHAWFPVNELFVGSEKQGIGRKRRQRNERHSSRKQGRVWQRSCHGEVIAHANQTVMVRRRGQIHCTLAPDLASASMGRAS